MTDLDDLIESMTDESDRLRAENERLREALRAIGQMPRASRPGASGLSSARAIANDALDYEEDEPW